MAATTCTTKFLKVGVFFLAISILAPDISSALPADNADELVSSLIEEIESNREELRTWKGEVNIRTESARTGNLPEGLPRHSDSARSFHFLYDRELERTILRGSESNQLMTASHTFMISSADEDPGARSVIQKRMRQPAVVESRNLSRNSRDSIFHPDQLVLYPSGIDLVNLLYIVRDRDGSEKYDVHFTEEGRLVTMTLQVGQSFNRYVFDRDKRGNLIRYEHGSEGEQENSPSERVEISYESVDDVYYPVRVERTTQNPGRASGGRIYTLNREQVIAISDSNVNEHVPEEELSLGSIGAQPGDTILDHTGGIIYEYEPGNVDDLDLDGTLTPGNEPTSENGLRMGSQRNEPSPQEPSRDDRSDLGWLGLGAIGILAIAGGACLRYWKKSGR